MPHTYKKWLLCLFGVSLCLALAAFSRVHNRRPIPWNSTPVSQNLSHLVLQIAPFSFEIGSRVQLASSRGILAACTLHSRSPQSSSPELRIVNWTYQAGDSIYVCNRALETFVGVLPRLTKPFVLVSGDADATIPERFPQAVETILKSPLVLHWYCQNWIGDHPKVSRLPISQDYHTMQTGNTWGPMSTALDQERTLFRIRADYGPFTARRVRCYANFHFRIEGAKYAGDRKDAIARVPKSLVYYEGSRLSRFRTWENQAHYAFVISPHGNGLDCHRTWEALALGSIPIVKTSRIDPVYEGLPVLIVKDWGDVSARLLNETAQRFSEIQWDYQRLTLAYWMNRIRASGNLTVA